MPRARTGRQVTGFYRVCWTSMVGRGQGRSIPMPREVAEFVAHDEELANPMHRYWIEACVTVVDATDERHSAA